MKAALENYFDLAQRGTNVRTEVMAGVTTFLTMAYIAFVNPQILSDAGMPFDAVFVATCIAAALSTLLMGLYANYPIALAPGMGLNAFFAYGVVLGMGHTWQVALGTVFVSGVLFLILSVLPVRALDHRGHPAGAKAGHRRRNRAVSGHHRAAQRRHYPGQPGNAGHRRRFDGPDPHPGPAWFLRHRRAGVAPGAGRRAYRHAGRHRRRSHFRRVRMARHRIAAARPNRRRCLPSISAGALQVGMLTVILTFLIVDLFDTAGTLIGVAHQADLLDADGQFPRMQKALIADSAGTVGGALLGTSPVTSYIESAAGASAGGRTGLTAVVVAVLFLACLFFAPLAGSIPPYATAAAILYVACLMARPLVDVDWQDVTESAAAVVTVIAIPLTFSIADGIGLGFLTYVVIKVIAGRWGECSPMLVAVALLFAVKFAWL